MGSLDLDTRPRNFPHCGDNGLIGSPQQNARCGWLTWEPVFSPHLHKLSVARIGANTLQIVNVAHALCAMPLSFPEIAGFLCGADRLIRAGRPRPASGINKLRGSRRWTSAADRRCAPHSLVVLRNGACRVENPLQGFSRGTFSTPPRLDSSCQTGEQKANNMLHSSDYGPSSRSR
jgi:hypothetical protein